MKQLALRARLRPFSNALSEESSLWLHGASLGECRALLRLSERLLFDWKNAPKIFLTTQKAEIVSTLQKLADEIQKSFPEKKIQVGIAPLPIRPIVKSFYRKVKPLALILIENELWPAYLAEEGARAGGAHLALISGRFNRAQRLPFFAIDFSAVTWASFQAEIDQERFLKKRFLNQKWLKKNSEKSDGEKNFYCEVGGNWKSLERVKGEKNSTREMGNFKTEKIFDVVFTSIHFGEWRFLENLAENLIQSKKTVLIAPRKLDECKLFYRALEKKKIPLRTYPFFNSGAITLIEKFGELSRALPKCQSAIIGGSFIKRPGIHDFLEPLSLGVYSYVGPFHKTRELEVENLLSKKILTPLSPYEKNLQPPKISSEEIIKFLNKEKQLCESSYQNLLKKLREWIPSWKN